MAQTKNVSVVLVHGGFVDGSGWEDVHRILSQDGYQVGVVQHPTVSLTGDVAATKMVIEAQDKPVVLVGHSYGGVVITAAGTHPKVKALVYVAAFAPDAGESVSSLIANPPPGAPTPPILPPRDGFLFLDRAKFHAAFAADVEADKAAFMADSQVPWGVEALGGAVAEPAWRSKPSWYLVATEDKMIPPPAQQMMAKRAGAMTVESPGSHAVYVSQPRTVAALIEMASRARAYERRDIRWNHTVSTARIGSTANAARARRTSSTRSTTMIPAQPATLVSASSSPCCSRLASASTSVVMRVMIRPPISRS